MAGSLWRSWRALFVSASVAAPAPPRDPLPDGPIEFQPFVVFDIETTGLRPRTHDDIVQIGAVRLDSGVETQDFLTLANPGRAIPPVSTGYHGITDAMVARAPPVRDAVAAFRDFCEGAVLVAHNAAFDGAAIEGAAERHGAPRLRNPLLCSMMLAEWLDPREPDLSLDGLCGRAGIVIEGRHRALGDARATAALWVALIARAAERGATTLPALWRLSGMERRMRAKAEKF
jgi:DNA polymerase-3 subunit epsilon